MGKLWKDVYWLYTAYILPCYNGIELYTPLYVSFICAYLVKVTIDIHGSPLKSPWGSRKYPGYNGQVRTWMCMCASVCGYEGVPIFCGISIMIADGLLLIWPPGHLQLHCSPSSDVAIISGETNDFVKQSWCQYLIKYEYLLCINSPPKARMQWFVEKCSRMLVKFMINQMREFKTPASLYDYTCVVIVKKVSNIISTISGAQKLHGF